ncbi:MAG: tetratricopeptide repeat protein, partial [Burkholderiales bacterium]
LLAVLLVGCSKDSTETLAQSAESYLAKGDWKSAIIQLKNLLQQSPDDGPARLLLGKAYLENQEYLLAESELRRALELDQPADQVMPALARAMLGRGEAQKLLDEFGTVRLLDRTAIAEFRGSLGDAYLRTGKRDEARAQYEAALAARSDNRRAR